jgi:HAD superfamily hydrolase (TIGR01509 family)
MRSLPLIPLQCTIGKLWSPRSNQNHFGIEVPVIRPQKKVDGLLRALIFDFDGIIVDSEPLILKLTQEMAAREGWTVTVEEYYRDYLALDDRGIVEQLYLSHGRPLDSAKQEELVTWKAKAYEKMIRDGLPALPGAVEFVRRVAAKFPLAIASGSLRSEVSYLLTKLSLRENFQALATAEDFEQSKPHPEVYLKALAGLQKMVEFRASALHPSQCLAIEDAPAGVDAAHAAGMKCLALTHSRPAHELRNADWVCSEFAEIDLIAISRAFEDAEDH